MTSIIELPSGAVVTVAPPVLPALEAAPPTTPPLVLLPSPGSRGQDGQPGGSVQRVTAQALSGHRLVSPLDNGTVDYADATNADHMNRPIWLTTDAWSSGVTATLVSAGLVTEPTWNWTPGQPIWLGANGQLTQTIPLGAVFVRRIGQVVNATTIEVNPSQPIATT